MLSCGDVVTIAMDPDLFKIAQEEHGGWDDIMAEVHSIVTVFEVIPLFISHAAIFIQ